MACDWLFGGWEVVSPKRYKRIAAIAKDEFLMEEADLLELLVTTERCDVISLLGAQVQVGDLLLGRRISATTEPKDFHGSYAGLLYYDYEGELVAVGLYHEGNVVACEKVCVSARTRLSERVRKKPGWRGVFGKVWRRITNRVRVLPVGLCMPQIKWYDGRYSEAAK